MNQNIKELKSRRDNLNVKIRTWVTKHKNAYELVKEFDELTTILKSNGCNVYIETDWLKLENWEIGKKYYHLRENIENDNIIIKHPRKNIENDNIIIKHPQETPNTSRENNNYSLSLSWTNRLDNKNPSFVSKMNMFLINMGMKFKNEGVFHNKNIIEHTYNYDFNGDDLVFKTIKTCAQQMIDILADDKFSIGVYGRKKN